MAGVGRKLASFLWWTYPRGSWEYDIMVGIILAFIFLTPRNFFRDQPRPANEPAVPSFSRLTPPLAPPLSRQLGDALSKAGVRCSQQMPAAQASEASDQRKAASRIQPLGAKAAS